MKNVDETGGGQADLPVADSEEDIAAVAGALIAPNSRSRVERLEFIDCTFSYRSLHALKTFTAHPSALRDLIVRTSNSFEPTAVRSMLQEVCVPRVSIELKMNEVVSASDFPFGAPPRVELSQEFLSHLWSSRSRTTLSSFSAEKPSARCCS